MGGYREYRDEFEAEWNNDGEAVIGDMFFSEFDTAKERALKMEGLRLYNHVLDERKERKQFVKQYGVLYDKKRKRRYDSIEDQRLEQEIADNLSMFARFTEDKNCNFAEFKSLCDGLMEEKKLRDKICKLKHYLLNGVTSVSQMEKIEKYVARQQELKANNDDIVTDEDEHPECRTSNEFLNRYNGCSLDSISTYLQLVEAEGNKTFKRRRNNKNVGENTVMKNEEEKEKLKMDEKEWNKMKKGREWKRLSEAE